MSMLLHRFQANQSRILPDSNSKVSTFVTITCGEEVYAPHGQCPLECPYFAELFGEGKTCYFMCVTANQCGTYSSAFDPEALIADNETMVCRNCFILGCDLCASGQEDRCERCATGYALTEEGTCVSAYGLTWVVVTALLALVLAVPLAWYVDLLHRPVSNPEGLSEGLAFRSRSKLLQNGPDGGDGPTVWPLTTNVHVTDVAGPGLALHFNFHRFLLVWSLGTISFWVIWAYSTDPELLVLGLYPSKTPHQMCSLTQHGKQAQAELMASKVLFLIILYICSVLGAMAYAYTNEQQYFEFGEESTMRDYAAVISGLPKEVATDSAEQDLAQAIQLATGQPVVGVSIGWDYSVHGELVSQAVEQSVRDAHDQLLKDAQRAASPSEASDQGNGRRWFGLRAANPASAAPEPPLPDEAQTRADAPQQSVHRGKGRMALLRPLFNRFDALFGFGPEAGIVQQERISVKEITSTLRSLKAGGMAFVVFRTEASRDAALEVKRRKGDEFVLCGERVRMFEAKAEPDTVTWDLLHIRRRELVERCLAGVLLVVLSLTIWCLGFYYPYAKWISSFHYGHGEEPGFFHSTLFSLLVIIGNQLLYFICSTVASNVGFIYTDYAEAFYTSIYTGATFLNLIGDLGVEWHAGYKAMVNNQVHTADGRLVADLVGWQEVFESYPMQKVLGSRLFAYCFPSCFLIPYIMEPIFAIFVPYHLMKLLVRSDKTVRGWEAEKSLQIFSPMDLSRYGDLLLNVLLATMILFFPPGTMLKLMLALFLSHAFIYVYDKFRVLRCVPSFTFSTSIVEKFSQAILAIPIGFILVAIVYKGNCMSTAVACYKGYEIFFACTCALVGHCVLHWLCLLYVVPFLARKPHRVSEDNFEEIAARYPCTWFTANPVHCLRSQYIHCHAPPCMPFMHGREYVMKANPKIGVHYEAQTSYTPLATEEYHY